MECIKNGYTAMGDDSGLEQDAREDLFIKLQRIAALKPEYTDFRIRSAYYIGLIHAKQGNNEQAGKYLLEVCQTAPASLNPESLWMKAKTLLLETLNLEGEF